MQVSGIFNTPYIFGINPIVSAYKCTVKYSKWNIYIKEYFLNIIIWTKIMDVKSINIES